MILSEELKVSFNKLTTFQYVESAIDILEHFRQHRLHLNFVKDLLGVKSKVEFDKLLKTEPFKVYTCVVHGRRYLAKKELIEILKAYHDHIVIESALG